MIKLRGVDSQNIYGTMNGGTVSLTNMTDSDKKMIKDLHDLESLDDYSLTKDDKSMVFREHRKAFAADQGFDWHKMFMMDQVNKDGSYFELTEDYVEANPNGWTDIPEDILIITDKVPGVVAGCPVADCPVVMMSDMKQGITAIAHCSANLIDKKLPMMVADALTQGYGSREENLSIIVGAHAGPNWTYDSWPNFASDKEFWKDCIVEQDGEFKINLRKALKKQFALRGLENCDTIYNMADTITDSRYYSNAVYRKQPEKLGRHFEGAFYEEEKNVRSR